MEVENRNGESDYRNNYNKSQYGMSGDNQYSGVDQYGQGESQFGSVSDQYAQSDGPVTGPLLPTPWEMNPMMNSMMGMMGGWNQNMMGQGTSMMMEMMPKQMITLRSCVLYPPPPSQ